MTQKIHIATPAGAEAEYDEDQVEVLWNKGQLPGDTLYWKEGMSEWRPLAEHFGATSAAQPPPIPASPTHAAEAAPAEGGAFHGYAGFWKRLAAVLVDSIVLAVVAVLAGAIVGFTLGGGENMQALSQVVGTIIGWLYFAGMESSSKQATLGKIALGIKVTDVAGNRIGFGRATGRHFAKILSAMILLIGYLMVAFTEKKQGLHDMLAGCLVVND